MPLRPQEPLPASDNVWVSLGCKTTALPSCPSTKLLLVSATPHCQPWFSLRPSRSAMARSVCVEHFHGNGTLIGEVCVPSTNSASFTPPAFNQKSILLWSKFHLTRCSSSKLPLLSLKTTWSLSWSKLRVTASLVLASSVRTLPAHPAPPCLTKASFYAMLISQNSREGSLLTLHVGLSNVQKVTNVRKDSFF